MGATGDALLNEVHPFHSVEHIGVDGVETFERLSCRSFHHVVIREPVNVGERFEERFWMATWQSAGGFSRRVHMGSVGISRVDRMWLAVTAERHFIRVFLSPGEGSLRTIDFDEQIVLAAVRNLAGGYRANSAVFEANDRVAIVVQLPAFLERFQVARHFDRQQSGHISSQIVRVSSDIAEASGGSRFRGVCSPRRLFLVGRFETGSQPALNVIRTDCLDLAEFSTQNHFASLSHQGVPRVIVRDGEDGTGLFDQLGEFFGLSQIERHRLVTNDVEARIESRFGRCEVSVIGGGNRHEINSFIRRQCGFFFTQLVKRAVRAVTGDIVRRCRRFGFRRIGRQGTRHQDRPVVQDGSGRMDATDKRALSATHQRHPQFAVQRTVCRLHNRFLKNVDFKRECSARRDDRSVPILRHTVGFRAYRLDNHFAIDTIPVFISHPGLGLLLMRVLVSEYCVGGASGGISTPSMRREGMAMLKAVTQDLGRLPDCSVVTMLESKIADSLDCEVVRIESASLESSIFDRLLHEVDAALIIAPETDGILADRCRQVRAARVASWNCTPESIELCGDKLSLSAHFQTHEIPTIPTRSVAIDRAPDGIEWPSVLKPRDGAGSTLTFLIRNRVEWDQAVQIIHDQSAVTEFILQPYREGRSLSVGVMIGPERTRVVCLPIAEQRLSTDGRFSYLGGKVATEVDSEISKMICGTIRRACGTISGLAGYIGVDLILKRDGTFAIVEINPRLTTSYVGYRELYADPLPVYWFSSKADTPMIPSRQPVDFTPDGICRSTAFHDEIHQNPSF